MVMMFNIDLRLLNVSLIGWYLRHPLDRRPPAAGRHSLLCAIDW